MKIIIFSFDNTLVDTSACKPHIHRATLVSRLVEKIEQGAVSTSIYDHGIVEYFNQLQFRADVLVLVVSESPKALCKAALSKHGFNIADEHIFGGQSKPCIDFDQDIIAPLNRRQGKQIGQYECLVAGYSPKDLYFAHYINSPMIFTTWATDFDPATLKDNIEPTGIASSLPELHKYVSVFLAGDLAYVKPDLRRHVRTVDPLNTEIVMLDQNNIGFARDYISSIHLLGNTDGRSHYTWMDINFGLKLAKGHSAQSINSGQAMPICFGGETLHKGLPLKHLAKYNFAKFVEWITAKLPKGKLALVPMPTSVPKVCNVNPVMSQVCSFWAGWANKAGLPFTFQVCDVLERWQPVKSSHRHYREIEQRTIAPHLSSIGVVDDKDNAIPVDIAAVIIVDDVITTGTQMNAAVSVLSAVGLVPVGVPVFGYCWGRTVLGLS
ncbi:MAG: phosphoribosyltransferase [Psychrosphaera sp.]|nr:phosphoribosyltransferase [Psychrosphaera sp.]